MTFDPQSILNPFIFLKQACCCQLFWHCSMLFLGLRSLELCGFRPLWIWISTRAARSPFPGLLRSSSDSFPVPLPSCNSGSRKANYSSSTSKVSYHTRTEPPVYWVCGYMLHRYWLPENSCYSSKYWMLRALSEMSKPVHQPSYTHSYKHHSFCLFQTLAGL